MLPCNHPTVFTPKVNHGVVTMVKELGYVNQGMQFYYRILDSNLDNALKPLSFDYDVMDMVNDDSEENDLDVDQEDTIDDVEVDMADFRKYTDENVEWVGCNEEEVEIPRPFVDKKVDLKDFDSEPKSDEEEFERKKIIEKVSVVQRRELHLTRNDKIKVRAKCRGVVLVFSNVKEQGMMGHVTTQDYIILTYVGVDPYNGTYPLAYAVVESETKESWIWFMDLP
ncbi:hypothetical protein Tco_1348905 [Tanacetum coccineum]